MPARRNRGLVDNTILAFGSDGRGLGCAAVGLTAALHRGPVLLDYGMVA